MAQIAEQIVQNRIAEVIPEVRRATTEKAYSNLLEALSFDVTSAVNIGFENGEKMESYTQQHFGMFSGEQKTVSLRFANRLLDTMVDRFGTGADVFYRPDGDEHFVVTTQIAISDQFYGWVSGFRKMAQIMSPPDVVADFQTFLDDIYGQYES